jgi:hypothetical protein
MEPDLNFLISNVGHCFDGLKLAGETFAKALEGMREASLKCDRDLKAKQAMADAEINRRRSEIEELKDQRHQLEREIAMMRKQRDAEKKEIGRELEKVRSLLSAA